MSGCALRSGGGMELGFYEMEHVRGSMLGVGPKLDDIWTSRLEVLLEVGASVGGQTFGH
jgi:hypothetical protein